jgi:hypothetical protein
MPLGELRTLTNVNGEIVEGEAYKSGVYLTNEGQKIDPPKEPTQEEIVAPKQRAPKMRTRRDKPVDQAANQDLKKRGIK